MHIDIYEKIINPRQENGVVAHCKEMIKEVNEILNDLSVRSRQEKASNINTRYLPKDFTNAIETLSSRIKASKPLSTQLKSRPVLSISNALGPGSYSIQRSQTPTLPPSSYFCSISKYK